MENGLCFQNGFNSDHVWRDPCLGLLNADCKEMTFWHTDVSGIGHKKHQKKKKKKTKIGIFQFVNNAYAWKLKSKSGMCLHHF